MQDDTAAHCWRERRNTVWIKADKDATKPTQRGQPESRHTKPNREGPQALTRPGHASRSECGDLLSNAVEDLGGGGAPCRRAENLRLVIN